MATVLAGSESESCTRTPMWCLSLTPKTGLGKSRTTRTTQRTSSEYASDGSISPRKTPQALDRDALEILPRSAQRRRSRSQTVSRHTVPSLGILYTPQAAATSSRRKRPPGLRQSRASVHSDQLHGCCRVGQQGKRLGRLLILPASHFLIVHRIAYSISSLSGVVKFGLVAAVRPGEIPTLRTRTPRALRRRESPCLVPADQIGSSSRSEIACRAVMIGPDTRLPWWAGFCWGHGGVLLC